MRRFWRFLPVILAALGAAFSLPGFAMAQAGGDTAPSSPILPFTAPGGQFVNGMDGTGKFLTAPRATLGAGPGNGVNVVTDFGADPTGAADSTAAFQNAVNAACNTPNAANLTHQVFVPSGYYTISSTISITGVEGCSIYGQGEQFLAPPDDGGTFILTSMITGDLFQFRGFGQFYLANISIDDYNSYWIGGATSFVGGASYARIHATGSGYAVNDTITLTGGTFTTATVIKVTAVSSGHITGSVIVTPGAYTVAPSPVTPVAQGSTSGGGSGATFDVVYANSAAISISGPTAYLSAPAASGAGSVTVGSASHGFTTAIGFAVAIELDSGNYYQTTIASVTGNTIGLAGTLPSAAAAGHPVYAIYAQKPIIENVHCADFWDCVRIENASDTTLRDVSALDYLHDGVIEFNGANPDGGGGNWQVQAWDFGVGTSNAGIEQLAGGVVDASGSSFERSNYGVLLNSYFGPTGTMLLSHGSYEEAAVCSIRLHQSVSGIEYANVDVIGNEFSNIANLSGQHFCVDEGTPNTNPKWIRNIVFSANHSNDYVTAAVSSINVQDGDNIVIQGNAFNNNAVAGPTGIAIGGNATHVVEAGNQFNLYPTGAYGTIQTSSLAPLYTAGSLGVGGCTIGTNAFCATGTTSLDGGLISTDGSGGLTTTGSAGFISGATSNVGVIKIFTGDGTIAHRSVIQSKAAQSTATTFNLPNVTGPVNLISSGDTGTVTNTMLAGSIAASKLVGTDIATVGTLTAGSINWSGNIATSGAVNLTGIAHAAGNEILCYDTTGGPVTYETAVAGCVPSALRFKNPQAQIIPTKALAGIMGLRPAVWTYKDTAKFGAQPYVGLYADDVKKMDPRCVTYEGGRLENYEDRCVLAYLTATVQAQQAEIADLKARAH